MESLNLLLRAFELASLFLVNIVWHEAGHVIGALLAGWKVKEVHIGEGKVMIAFPLCGTMIIWHWNMLFSGMVKTEVTEFRDYKLREFYTVAGSLLATLALSAGFMLLWQNVTAVSAALHLNGDSTALPVREPSSRSSHSLPTPSRASLLNMAARAQPTACCFESFSIAFLALTTPIC
ncbi:MAG: site-2 protease family protein [Candidatus Methylacidiphilales bacterium]|nr:site-2 protease family protein [Candidatus Methylacidiphilales bacterium]